MRAWVITGKLGDILAILPAIQAEHDATGVVQNVVVSRHYASLLDGLPFCKAVVTDLHWQDLKGVIAWAKQRFDSLRIPQIHGSPDFKFQRKRPSFVLDMWERAGWLSEFDNLPLTIPFPKGPDTGAIFYADHSESSPFFHREDLAKLIQETFPDRQLIRASGIRMKNIRDLLPIMDGSALIVSVETSFLHLSAACSKPVIAFVADKPDPWRGTPWQRRFVMHCRYSDFEFRKDEIVAAMNQAVNKMSVPQPAEFSTAKPHGYNMTSLNGVNIYRYHSGSWKTKLALDDGRNWTQDIKFPPECEDYSLEDGRLFMFKGKMHLEYTCAREIENMWRCIQAYGPLEKIGVQWTVTQHIAPKLPGNDFSGMQKNWTPFEHGGKLYMIHGIRGEAQVVHEFVGDKSVATHESDAPVWKWGQIRGGAIAPYKGHLLRIFHSRVGNTHRHYGFRYYIGAALMEAEPPFRTVAVSSFPILAGNEKYADARFWKPNCCLPYGLEVDRDFHEIEISGGLNDCRCFTMKLTAKDLNL